MLTSDIRNDLWPIPSSTAYPSDSGRVGAGQAADAGLNAPFELLLAQVLLRLLERLDAAGAAPSASANGLLRSDDFSRPPVWILPTLPAQAGTGLQPLHRPQEPAPSASSGQALSLSKGQMLNAPTPLAIAPGASAVEVAAAKQAYPPAAASAAALSDFPRPPGDNGRGMHWIPTTASMPETVDRFVAALKAMRIKWVTLLNDGANVGANDTLVQQVKANGMEPIMRIYTPGLQPISGDLGAAVRHYKSLGVSYFQLYNEPNHSIENDGRPPDVNRYLDLWIPAARTVLANGGLPGFGALSPGGEFKDTEFLSQAIDGLKARGEQGLLDRAWLSIHNYQGDRPLADSEAFSRFKVYADILKEKLGRVMPMIGTEGGSFAAGPQDEARRTALVTDAYRYMANREPYNFAYTYWVVANSAGGGQDPAWEWQALIHPDGQSPLVEALTELT